MYCIKEAHVKSGKWGYHVQIQWLTQLANLTIEMWNKNDFWKVSDYIDTEKTNKLSIRAKKLVSCYL
jgi:hypothetical protein